MKNSLKNFFGSIYIRFLVIFIGSFMLSLLVPAIGTNISRVPQIRRDAHSSMTDTASKIKELTDSREMSAEEAADLFSERGENIRVFYGFDELDIPVTENDKEDLRQGKIVSVPHDEHVRDLAVLFMAEEKIVVLRPDYRKGPMAEYHNMQIFFVAIPLALGTILIILASITVAKPIKQISNVSKKVAKGDFSVRLTPKGSGEIRELEENFNSMVEELSSNEYLHKEFVSNVSHEFGTPITSLLGYAKLLKRNDLSPEKRTEYADIIISESERLSRLSSDLLRLSELERETEIDRHEFSLDEQIRSVVILLQNSWENKDISLDISLDEVRFSGDEPLLHQLWINLVSNAVRYTDNGGEICISLKKDGRNVIVSVKDNGKGMTAEEAANVFRRFYKADRSRSSEGTGLGLAIAKKIAELHGGEISVKSSENNGSEFTVILPIIS